MKKLGKLTFRKILLLLVIIGAVSVGSVTVAKYVIEEFHGYYLNSKHFYFTSNRLKKNNPVYLVNNWSGVGSFDISFDLIAMKNSLVYTDFDIPYTVSYDCPTGVTCSFDKPTGTVYKNSENHSDTVTLTVNPSRAYAENEHLIIGITASSVSPYVETIYARFEYVVGKKGVTYEIEDVANRPYMVLKITNAISYCTVIEAFGDYTVNTQLDNSVFRQLSAADKAKCVGEEISLSFDPSVVVLDTTGDIVKTATIGNTTLNGISYVSSLNFHIDPVSTMAIKFYKNNTAANYTYPSAGSPIINVTFST